MGVSIKIPLQVKGNKLERNDKEKKAIDESLQALLNTPVGTVPCDPQYGFTLQQLRFEMINEGQGTIYNGGDDIRSIYDKKMSGTSKNLQTFASDFNDAIKKYEPRLGDTNVAMTYVAQSRTIVFVIKGIIKETGEDYKYTTTLKLWT